METKLAAARTGREAKILAIRNIKTMTHQNHLSLAFRNKGMQPTNTLGIETVKGFSTPPGAIHDLGLIKQFNDQDISKRNRDYY